MSRLKRIKKHVFRAELSDRICSLSHQVSFTCSYQTLFFREDTTSSCKRLELSLFCLRPGAISLSWMELHFQISELHPPFCEDGKLACALLQVAADFYFLAYCSMPVFSSFHPHSVCMWCVDASPSSSSTRINNSEKTGSSCLSLFCFYLSLYVKHRSWFESLQPDV